MKVETLSIHDVHPDPANVRKHPERNLAAIRGSLARFGQVKPIVVDAQGIIRAGNGTYEAARQLGWDSILAVRTDLSGTEATAYAIADNRTADLAEWDETALAEQLRALQSEDFDLDAVGYTGDEVDAMLEKLAGEIVDDPAGEWEGMPEFAHEDKTPTQSIQVHFKTTEDVATFAELVGQTITENTRSIWYPEAEIERYSDKAYVTEPGD